ncbi:MAG: ECF transporter S component [Bacillota bacterium]
MHLSTRQTVLGGLMVAMTAVLGLTGVGFIPVPIPVVGAATIMHIPVILAAIFGGPVVGGLAGLVFGLSTLKYVPDPRVVLPARILIGVVAYYVYVAVYQRLGHGKRTAAGAGGAAAGVLGSLTNTVGTLGLAVLFKWLPLKAAMVAAGANGVPELILSGFVTAALMPALLPALAHWEAGKHGG